MINRREMLHLGVSGLGLSLLPKDRLLAEGSQPLRVGLIGSGWYGKIDLFRLLQVAPVEVVSLCDVDSVMLADAAEQIALRQSSHKKPRTFSDYREMLREKDLDVCLIATPDHWHALTAIAAMEAGADVYLQKPISLDIAEGQAILACARKHKRTVQVGLQRRSTPHLVEARDRVIREGLLGNIGMVDICCYYQMRSRDRSPEIAPPAHLDWEMYTGPAPVRPYLRTIHPRGWRAFMEYGNGIVGDMGVHMLDMVRWMLKLGWPIRVSSTGGILMEKGGHSNITDTQQVIFDFDTLQVIWTHRTWGSVPDPKYPWAATFYGDKGTLKAGVMGYDYYPLGKTEPVLSGQPLYEYERYPEDKTEKDLERHVSSAVRRHMLDLLAHRTDRSRPVADVEEGHISTASCLLGNLALKMNRTLEWNAKEGRIVNDAEANRLLQRPYRAPWQHPKEKYPSAT